MAKAGKARRRVLALALAFGFGFVFSWAPPQALVKAGTLRFGCGDPGGPRLAAVTASGTPPETPATRPPSDDVSLMINVDDRTLTVFSDGIPYRTFPVAVGKPDTPSPLGEWTVVYKGVNWGGGFGTRWLGLSVPWGIYGIHGSNRPGSIGTYASHGCFRMFNRNVEQLYTWVRVGTPVGVIGTPSRLELFNGNKGFQVLEVQARLRELGLYHGRVDGVFGAALTQSLVRFQRAEGLKPDGNVGPAVYRDLGLLPAPAYTRPMVPEGWSG